MYILIYTTVFVIIQSYRNKQQTKNKDDKCSTDYRTENIVAWTISYNIFLIASIRMNNIVFD